MEKLLIKTLSLLDYWVTKDSDSLQRQDVPTTFPNHWIVPPHITAPGPTLHIAAIRLDFATGTLDGSRSESGLSYQAQEKVRFYRSTKNIWIFNISFIYIIFDKNLTPKIAISIYLRILVSYLLIFYFSN